MTDQKLRQLMADMSMEEKVGQLMQLSADFFQQDVESVVFGPAEQLGIPQKFVHLSGSVVGTYGAEILRKLQSEYMEKHPHHIPLLTMSDVIHGLKTVFPMPLAQAATFEPELSEHCASVAALEASVAGLHVTFAPMADLVRDARWGRVMESFGEDPYLLSRFTEAMVYGFQGDDICSFGKLCACVKHFAAYGAVEAGRDYASVQISNRTFREYYLKGYKAGIDAGARMVMTSFSTVDDIPATVNKQLTQDILRSELGFDGVLISDHAALSETIAHGYSENEREAAVKGINAGVDIDMMSSVYASNLISLVLDGQIPESLIDESVWRVLKLKNQLGLFENPYKDANAELEAKYILCDEHRALAREAARKSFVLLENDGILPLNPNDRKKIAFIGPYVDNKNIISFWGGSANARNCVTVREAAQEVFANELTQYISGTAILGEEDTRERILCREHDNIDQKASEMMMADAVEAAKNADVVVMALGEHRFQSGEAASRAHLKLPWVQIQLLKNISKVNSNVVVVLFNGRPLDLREVRNHAKAVLEVWLPGTEGGHAIIDVLTGAVSPSGKLPMSFPYCVGQVPVYYNEFKTGRPQVDGKLEKYKSQYIDIPNQPLYPFGYGMSYTNFEYTNIQLSDYELSADNELQAEVTITNVGTVTGTEIVQLYIQDQFGSVVRPKKELKGFKKITLAPREMQKVVFRISEQMLRFVRADNTFGSEAGSFLLWIAGDSVSGNPVEFILH